MSSYYIKLAELGADNKPLLSEELGEIQEDVTAEQWDNSFPSISTDEVLNRDDNGSWNTLFTKSDFSFVYLNVYRGVQ